MTMNLSATGTGSTGAAHLWSGASAPMSPTQKMSNLFDQIDASGSGSISQSQFAQAFQAMDPPASFQAAGADAVWSKLDPTGSGTVSKEDFVTGMTAMMKQLRTAHHRHHSAAGAQALTQNTSLLDALTDSTAAKKTPATDSGVIGTIINELV